MKSWEEKTPFDQQIDSVIAQLSEWISLPANPRATLLQVSASPPMELKQNERSRLVLYHNDLLELVLMTWGPGSSSSIHGHGGSQCYMNVLSGKLIETRHRPFEVEPLNESSLGPGVCAYIHDGASFHRLSSEVGAISLHLYSKPLQFMQAYDELENNWSQKATHDLD